MVEMWGKNRIDIFMSWLHNWLTIENDMNPVKASHLCSKFTYIVLLVSQLPCFLLMTKGEKYMNWCYKHWCYDYAMLASPRDIWIDAMINLHYTLFVSRQDIKQKTCIVILRVDILPCDEMQYLLKYLKCVHHVMISKSYFTALHVDILQYDELLLLPSFKHVM